MDEIVLVSRLVWLESVKMKNIDLCSNLTAGCVEPV